MKSYRGTIRKNDLEGGFWELVTKEGERYQIKDADDAMLVEGQEVVIEGKQEKDQFGIGMVGSYLSVASWEAPKEE